MSSKATSKSDTVSPLLDDKADAYYMYVVECADGTLYTGYARNVEERIATHNAGRGAKYTKSRLPVSLIICARFDNKHAALSAEARFKQLSRTSKLELIHRALSENLPFEQVFEQAF